MESLFWQTEQAGVSEELTLSDYTGSQREPATKKQQYKQLVRTAGDERPFLLVLLSDYKGHLLRRTANKRIRNGEKRVILQRLRHVSALALFCSSKTTGSHLSEDIAASGNQSGRHVKLLVASIGEAELKWYIQNKL